MSGNTQRIHNPFVPFRANLEFLDCLDILEDKDLRYVITQILN